jgi:hypothetical protein
LLKPSAHKKAINPFGGMIAMRSFPEADWKKLRALKTTCLNKKCERVLEEARKVINKKDNREHEAYLDLWKLLQNEDRTIALLFDDFKRSTAIFKIVGWLRYGLISNADLAIFTDETRETVARLNELER